jgi:hypothetical protein
MTGTLKPKLIHAPKAPLSWRLRNTLRLSYLWGWLVALLAYWFSRLTGSVTMTSSLELRVKKLNEAQRREYEQLLARGMKYEAESYYERYAVWKNFGVVSRRVITNAGVTYMRDDFNNAAGGADITLFRYHRSGSSSTAEAAGDVALGAEVPYAALGSQGTNGSNVYQTIGTIVYYLNYTIREHGLFSASTSTTLWDRSVFADIGVAPNDSIQFTYNLTINAGG